MVVLYTCLQTRFVGRHLFLLDLNSYVRAAAASQVFRSGLSEAWE